MNQPFHSLFNLFIFFILTSLGTKTDTNDLVLIIIADLIDLDHLFSRPIYKKGRNPFKTHFLHKNWKILMFLSIAAVLFYRPLAFLGAGLISHLFLDWIYVKNSK